MSLSLGEYREYKEARIRRRVRSSPRDTLEKFRADIAEFEEVFEKNPMECDFDGDSEINGEPKPTSSKSVEGEGPRTIKTRLSTGSLPLPRERFYKETDLTRPSIMVSPKRKLEAKHGAAGGKESKKGHVVRPRPQVKMRIAMLARHMDMTRVGVDNMDRTSHSGMYNAENEMNEASDVEMDLDEDESSSERNVGPSRPRGRGRPRKNSGSEEGPLEIPLSEGFISDGVYHLERIVDSRVALREGTSFVRARGLDYRVKWKGWPDKFNSWEVEENVGDLADYALRKFWERQSRDKNQMESSQILTTKAPAMNRMFAAVNLF